MKKLWIAFVVVIVVSFSVLGWVGTRIYQQMPPIPDKIMVSDGRLLLTGDEIHQGQHVWQAMGGMEVGSVWGHGSYVAPDWTADWLHRECVFILNRWAELDFKKPFDQLESEPQATLERRLQNTLRKNTYSATDNTITIDPVRAEAFENNAAHFSDVFVNGREDYAIRKGAVLEENTRAMAAFFFWTSWAASTERPYSNTV